MAAERKAIVIAVDAAGGVQLHADTACSGCACQGRCDVLAALGQADDVLRLGSEHFARAPQPGQRVRLSLPESGLLREAWHGYGVPLAGLLFGATIGHGLALSLNLEPNRFAATAAVLGTWLGARRSKRRSRLPLRVSVVAFDGKTPTTSPIQDEV